MRRGPRGAGRRGVAAEHVHAARPPDVGGRRLQGGSGRRRAPPGARRLVGGTSLLLHGADATALLRAVRLSPVLLAARRCRVGRPRPEAGPRSRTRTAAWGGEGAELSGRTVAVGGPPRGASAVVPVGAVAWAIAGVAGAGHVARRAGAGAVRSPAGVVTPGVGGGARAPVAAVVASFRAVAY